MPSKGKSFWCISHDPVTDPGLGWLPKIPQLSAVSLSILLPLVWVKFPDSSWEKLMHVHAVSESARGVHCTTPGSCLFRR